MVLIIDGSVEQLAYHTQDVDSGGHDRAACQDDKHAVEEVGVLERADKDGHLGHESRETGKTERRHTGYHVADGEIGKYLHHTAHLADVTSVGTSVYHTDEREEEGCHQTVRKHLHDGSRHGCGVEHEDCKEHQTAV